MNGISSKGGEVKCEVCGCTHGSGVEEREHIMDFGVCFKCAHAQYRGDRVQEIVHDMYDLVPILDAHEIADRLDQDARKPAGAPK